MMKELRQFYCILWIFTSLSVIFAKRSSSLRDVKQTNKLYSKLLSDYNQDVRPVADAEASLDVSFGLSVIEVLGIDENNGHMTTNIWLKMLWNDVSLRWNPGDYGGVKQLHIPAKQLWLPDIIMYNGFESFINKDLDAIVSYDGTVLWEPPALIRLTCRHEFRGNSWVCPMQFGSWTYSGDELNIVPYGDSLDIDVSHYISADMWEIVEGGGQRRNHGSGNPIMEYILRLKNKTLGRISIGRK